MTGYSYQIGSLLMFDWPPPVGYSYCNNEPSGDGNSCGVWNDTRAANAEYAAVRGWFDDLFPEYKVQRQATVCVCVCFFVFFLHEDALL